MSKWMYALAHKPDGTPVYCFVEMYNEVVPEGYRLFEYNDPRWLMPYKQFHRYTLAVGGGYGRGIERYVYFNLSMNQDAGLWILECYGAMCYNGYGQLAFWWGDIP